MWVVGETVLVANVGDARAVLARLPDKVRQWYFYCQLAASMLCIHALIFPSSMSPVCLAGKQGHLSQCYINKECCQRAAQ